MSQILKRCFQYYGKMQVQRHGFWFIDIPRTSSSSLRVELANVYGCTYGKRRLIEKEYSIRHPFPDHIPAKRMKEILGLKLWKRIYKFTFVRNPWDRMVSLYNYRKKVGHIPADMTFRDYLFCLKDSEFSKGGLFPFHAYYYGCSDYVLDDNHDIIVDFIGRYENRRSDIARIAAKIGCDSLGNLAIQKASSSNKHYSDYYDRETREIIKTLYEKDIDLFNYEL
jgi:hypothetical protein